MEITAKVVAKRKSRDFIVISIKFNFNLFNGGVPF